MIVQRMSDGTYRRKVIDASWYNKIPGPIITQAFKKAGINISQSGNLHNIVRSGPEGITRATGSAMAGSDISRIKNARVIISQFLKNWARTQGLI